MRIVVVSPPDAYVNEQRWVCALFDAGLDRYHLRKPAWPAAQLANWLESVPKRHHGRIVLHAHHALSRCFDVLGVHFRDQNEMPLCPEPQRAVAHFCSRSCHDVAAVKRALGRYAAVFFGPVFASHSKPGYGPVPEATLRDLSVVLALRATTPATEVLAIGGITRQRLALCRDLGFDGAAVIGAVWDTRDPLVEYLALHEQARDLCTKARERSIGS